MYTMYGTSVKSVATNLNEGVMSQVGLVLSKACAAGPMFEEVATSVGT